MKSYFCGGCMVRKRSKSVLPIWELSRRSRNAGD